MLVLIPVLIVAGLFLAACFAPLIWRRQDWRPGVRMLCRPLVRYQRHKYHRRMYYHRRYW